MRAAETLPDLYKALGVAPGTDAEGIATAYRTAARRSHPDAGGSHEEFIVVDLAWRLLRDADTRHRFDALWRLQVALASSESTSLATARLLLDDADSAVAGWRVPVELRSGIDGLLEQSRKWAQRIAESASHERASSDQPSGGPTDSDWDERRREAEDMVRRSTERYMAYFREAAVRDMAQWPQALRNLRLGATVKARRAGLADGYRIYTTLRKLQDSLDGRRRTGLTADDLRLYFHVSDAVIDVRATLLEAQVALGRSYSFKNEKWLIDCRRRAERELTGRNLAADDPPWTATKRSTKADPADESAPSDASAANDRSSSGASHSRAGNGDGSTRPSGGQPSSAKGASDGSPRSDGVGSSRGNSSRLVGGTALFTACIVVAWLGRRYIVDVLAIALAVALLLGFVWAVTVSADLRRGLGLLLLAVAKLTWLVLRGFAAVALGLLGLISRRR